MSAPPRKTFVTSWGDFARRMGCFWLRDRRNILPRTHSVGEPSMRLQERMGVKYNPVRFRGSTPSETSHGSFEFLHMSDRKTAENVLKRCESHTSSQDGQDTCAQGATQLARSINVEHRFVSHGCEFSPFLAQSRWKKCRRQNGRNAPFTSPITHEEASHRTDSKSNAIVNLSMDIVPSGLKCQSASVEPQSITTMLHECSAPLT